MSGGYRDLTPVASGAIWTSWSPSLVVQAPVYLSDLFHAIREVRHQEWIPSTVVVGYC